MRVPLPEAEIIEGLGVVVHLSIMSNLIIYNILVMEVAVAGVVVPNEDSGVVSIKRHL